MATNNYLKLPLALGDLHKKRQHERCSLRQSVAQNLHLILTTSFGEMLIDPSFGSAIWDSEFSNITFDGGKKESVVQKLQESIKAYEQRIDNCKITLNIEQDRVVSVFSNDQMKRKLVIQISAVLKHTNESIVYRDSFFIAPLAYN